MITMHSRKSHDHLIDYFLVDFAAKYQKGFRNNIVPVYKVPGLIREFGQYEAFCSYFLYSGDILDYSRSNTRNGKPSVSGYDGPVYATYLPIDIDSPDLDQALGEMRKIVGLLKDDWRCTDHSFNNYFSGGGFHVAIRSGLFGDLEPSKDLHIVFSKLRRGIAEQADLNDSVVDYSIKDKLRLLRLPNTVNAKSNLYKIQLGLAEVLGSTAKQIRSKAVRPGPLWNTDETGLLPRNRVEPNKHAVELYEKALREVKRAKSRYISANTRPTSVIDSPSEKLFCKARQKMWYSQIPDGSRNNSCVRLVSELRLQGLTEPEAENMISFWNQNNEIGLPLEEIKGIVRTVYSSRAPYDYGCRDEIIHSFCPFEDKSRCQHYREYKRLASGNLVSKA